ncbi:hypothetical protein BASA83_008041 [Batrachochytrium salamandrivorans]|nr:hypothetical protein BASA83_008041 [Batrachochytrium salamandrivorans]
MSTLTTSNPFDDASPQASPASPIATALSDWRTFDEESDGEVDDSPIQSDSLKYKWYNRCCDLFAVDASPLMHSVPDGQSISPFSAALLGIAAFLQEKILQNDADTIGLMFYSTRESQNLLAIKSIYVKYDLDLPDINRILELESIAQEATVFNSQIGSSSEDYNYSDIYWVASTIFSKGAPDLSRKRLLVITNEDSPEKIDSALHRVTRSRIAELERMHISVELFPVDKSATRPFILDVFYRHIPEFWAGDDVDLSTIPLDDNFIHLRNRIYLKKHKRKVAFRIPLHITGDLTIGIRGFYIVKDKMLQSSHSIERGTEKEVELQYISKCMTTGHFLIPTDLKHYYTFGGEKVVFCNEEMLSIKSFGPPGMTLVGFMNISELKPKHNLRPSVFIFPDETLYTGSCSLFAHLLQRTWDRKKMAVCKLIARQNSSPRMIALLPQVQSVDFFENNAPAGFHAIFLPFGDDLRSIAHRPADVTSTILDAATELFGHATNSIMDFSLFANPVIDRHNAYVEALALGRDCPRETQDATMPDEVDIHESYGDLIDKLKLMCDAPMTGVSNIASGSRVIVVQPGIPKRESLEINSSKSKKSRPAPELVDIRSVGSLISQDKLSILTIAQLMQFLKSVGLKIHSQRKADLLKQVLFYFESV